MSDDQPAPQPYNANASAPVLTGPRVRLRPPQPDDLADRIRSGRSIEFRHMVGAELTPEEIGALHEHTPHQETTRQPFPRAAAERWYAEVAASATAWMIEWRQRCIGSARLHHLDMTHRQARYAIGIFDPSCWNQRLGAESTQLVLAHAFDSLNLHRVDLRVLAYNTRAIRSYAKCGFVQEGVEREGVWLNGRWESDVWMSILEDEYRQRAG